MISVQFKEEKNLHNGLQFRSEAEAKAFKKIAYGRIFRDHKEADMTAARMFPQYRKDAEHAFKVLHPHEVSPYNFEEE